MDRPQFFYTKFILGGSSINITMFESSNMGKKVVAFLVIMEFESTDHRSHILNLKKLI